MATRSISFETYLHKSMNYASYLALIQDLVSEGKTTGPVQTENLIEFTKLNFHRMQRLNKTIVLNEDLQEAVDNLKRRWIWLVITEAWCGDAAQTIPLMHALTVASGGKIDLRMVLRDENLELMDKYLTNGGRAIPILICLDADTLEQKGTWGPRPAEAQQMVMDFKANPTMSPAEFKLVLHTWYTNNKTQLQQREMLKKIGEWQREK
jgi:hypothetical protein